MFAYVGSRTTEERNARGIGISVYRLDQERGVLELIQQVEDLVNPSFLAINRAGDRLYAVHGDRSDVSAFKIDNASGYLQLLNSQCCEGKNPVHLALSADERHLVVSNHITGTLAVMEVDDGRAWVGGTTRRLGRAARPASYGTTFSQAAFQSLRPHRHSLCWCQTRGLIESSASDSSKDA